MTSKLYRLYNLRVHKENWIVYSSFYDNFNNEALKFVYMCLDGINVWQN